MDSMARLARIGPNECGALRKLSYWSEENRKKLIELIDQYERYQTQDVKPRGHQGQLARGERLTIPNVLLKSLARVSEVFFSNNCENVLNGKYSLKCLVEEFDKSKEVEKVVHCLCVIAKYTKYEDLVMSHPGKFGYTILKQFLGAEVSVNGLKNSEAERLESYFCSVFYGETANKEKIECLEYKSLGDVLKGGPYLAYLSRDLLIYIMKLETNLEMCKDLVSNRVLLASPSNCTIIIFPSETIHFTILSYIRNLVSDSNPMVVKPILFNTKPMKKNDIRENVIFGVIFGNFTVHHPPLDVYHQSQDELLNIVEKLLPVDSPVSLICDEGVPPVKIHKDCVSRSITYIGFKKDLAEFRLKEDIPVEMDTSDWSELSESQFDGAFLKVTSTPSKI